jgi:hypothetical protein
MAVRIWNRWLTALVVFVMAVAALAGIAAAPAGADTTFVVDTVADNAALSACTGAPDDCSLRGAVAAANATAGADTIMFDIPTASCPSGVCRITLTEGEIDITEALLIDGTSQPQNDGPQTNVCATATEPSHMRIELVSNPAAAASIFVVSSPSTIRGLAFGNDVGGGVHASIYATGGAGHHFSCNHFGLDAAGSTALGSSFFYGEIIVEASASGVVVGTNGDGVDDIAERNVFGATGYAVYVNANDNNRISGNYIGFTADGTPTSNSGTVLVRQSSSHNLIGVEPDGISDDIEPNYFSDLYPIGLNAQTAGSPTDNRVIGNYVGIGPNGDVVGSTFGIQVLELDGDVSGFVVEDNVIVDADQGIRVTGADNGLAISDNLIGVTRDGTSAGNGIGIRLEGSVNPSISNNFIADSTTTGLDVIGTASVDTGSTGNCVVGNTTGVSNTTGTPITFENNWWGASDGPSGSGAGSGDAVTTDVDYDPWLTSEADICNPLPVVSDAAFSIAEDAAVGTSVGTVTATDDEALTYTITAGDPGGAFAIDLATGEITTAAALDYEATPSYSLTVDVDDGLHSAEATVDITVTNVAPTVSNASFSVAEDAAVGTSLGTVSGDDGAATLEYSITNGNTGGAFAIDAATGEITTAAALDYETTPSYTLTVAASDGSLSGTATVSIAVTDVAEGPTFDDVPETDTFYADVEWLAASGITKGCNPPANTLFCPDDSVTRGQMAAFLHRGLGGVLTPGAPVTFTDTTGSVFEADIEWLGSVGVTKGCNPPANDMFCPNDVVTRGQMAAFLVRALGLTDDGGGNSFVDDDGSVFETDIAKLAAAGITKGCNPPTNDMFCPNDPVTRAQMAAFLHRALG